MSASSSPSVLIVADPARVAELSEALAEPLPQGAIELLASSGGDDTIELFESRKPRVVVLTASLEVGDAKSLIEVLRDLVPRDEVVIVLVGEDANGSVRTALDAIDMKPDRFVSRPLSVKALRFAVGSGLDTVARALGELPPADSTGGAESARVPGDEHEPVTQPVEARTSTPLRGSGGGGSQPGDAREQLAAAWATAGTEAAAAEGATPPSTSPREPAVDETTSDSPANGAEPSATPTVTPQRGSGRVPLIGHITEAPFVRSSTTPRFSALVEGGDVPPMVSRAVTRPVGSGPNGEDAAPSVPRAPTERGTGVPPLPEDGEGADGAESAEDADGTSPNVPRAPTDRGTGITMTTPAAQGESAPDPEATRAALRARWEALADSIGGDDLDESLERDTQHPPASAIEIQPSAVQHGDEAELSAPVREPTLILRDEIPARPAPPADAAPPMPAPPPVAPPASASAVTERGPSERWSNPVLLAELIDRSRDSSRELLANVGGIDDLAGLDELDDDLVGHPAHTPGPHVMRGGHLQPLEDMIDADGALDTGSSVGRVDIGSEPASEPPARPSEERIGGRDFARQLRAKMSMMAQRLFQSDSPAAHPSVDVRPHHDHHTEIDLAALAEEPALGGGVTEIGTPTPDPVQLATSPGSWDTQVRERGLPDSGEIVRGVSDVSMMLARMFALGFTGRVGFRKDEVEKVVYFDGGRPVFASSNEPGDRMGELLVREGKITASQYERCQVVVAQSGRRMGEILVDFGYLKRRELLPAVRRHVEDILYSLFGWDRGHYHVTEEPTASAERIRLSRHPASLVLEGIRRKLDRTTLEKVLGPPSTVIEVSDRERLGGILNTGDLAAEERAALAAFDGQADLAQVAAASGVDIADVLPLAWGLCVLGLATARRAEIEHEESTALVGETDLAIDRERVRARWQLVTEADYFALLGVRRDATGFEIRRAYQAARRDFAPDGFPPDLRRELARELEEIGSVLDEAFRVLRDDRLRHTYLANLIE